MSKPRRWKRIGKVAIATTLAIGGFCFGTNRAVLNSADGRVFSSASAIPYEPVALVLGTAPRFNGNANPFFWNRMRATAKLYKAGKVGKVLVSGDHGTVDYNEPTAMRDALVKLGIPSKAIYLDYAGFRTLDSIVRAHKIFGVDRCTIVTDDFHLPRALYLASKNHLDAVGYQTDPIDRSISPWTYVREVGARSLTWVDIHVTKRQPRFLGRRESIL